jgi:hypothetical protein
MLCFFGIIHNCGVVAKSYGFAWKRVFNPRYLNFAGGTPALPCQGFVITSQETKLNEEKIAVFTTDFQVAGHAAGTLAPCAPAFGRAGHEAGFFHRGLASGQNYFPGF